jgi:hypothetical protein
MSSALLTGLGLALGSALALNIGFLLQQGAAAGADELSLRRPLASARALLGSGRWTLGFCLGLSGWGLYFAALTLAPLSLVQTVAASGIGLLVVLVAVARRALPVRREQLGATLATLGLMALALSIGNSAGTTGSAPSALGLTALAIAGLVVVAFALRRSSAALGGLAAGLCYGVGDVTTKAMLLALPVHLTAGALFASPYLYATAAAHGLGFVLLQRAFQHGGPIASLGPMTAAANLLPMAAGVALLGEQLPSGAVGLALRIGAFAAAAAGAWALAGRSAPAGDPLAEAEAARWLQPPLPTAAR